MPLNEQASVYFIDVHNRKGREVIGQLQPHPRIFEFLKLRYFWKEFGLNKVDLSKLPPVWVDEMYAIGAGYDDAKAKIESQNSSVATPIANKSLRGNVVRTKLI